MHLFHTRYFVQNSPNRHQSSDRSIVVITDRSSCRALLKAVYICQKPSTSFRHRQYIQGAWNNEIVKHKICFSVEKAAGRTPLFIAVCFKEKVAGLMPTVPLDLYLIGILLRRPNQINVYTLKFWIVLNILNTDRCLQSTQPGFYVYSCPPSYLDTFIHADLSRHDLSPSSSEANTTPGSRDSSTHGRRRVLSAPPPLRRRAAGHPRRRNWLPRGPFCASLG